MKIQWPLWWCLEPEAQALLMQFQWDNYGLRLDIPPLSTSSLWHAPLSFSLEELEEIDRIIRQRPHYPKGAKWRG